MKFFKGILEDLFGHKKTNKFRLTADVSKYGSSPSFRKQLGEEPRRVVREKSLGAFRER